MNPRKKKPIRRWCGSVLLVLPLSTIGCSADEDGPLVDASTGGDTDTDTDTDTDADTDTDTDSDTDTDTDTDTDNDSDTEPLVDPCPIEEDEYATGGYIWDIECMTVAQCEVSSEIDFIVLDDVWNVACTDPSQICCATALYPDPDC